MPLRWEYKNGHAWAVPSPKEYSFFHCHRCGAAWGVRQDAPPCTKRIRDMVDWLFWLRWFGANLTIGGAAYLILRLWRVI